MIQLTFPDGAVKEFEAGITAEDVDLAMVQKMESHPDN